MRRRVLIRMSDLKFQPKKLSIGHWLLSNPLIIIIKMSSKFVTKNWCRRVINRNALRCCIGTSNSKTCNYHFHCIFPFWSESDQNILNKSLHLPTTGLFRMSLLAWVNAIIMTVKSSRFSLYWFLWVFLLTNNLDSWKWLKGKFIRYVKRFFWAVLAILRVRSRTHCIHWIGLSPKMSKGRSQTWP